MKTILFLLCIISTTFNCLAQTDSTQTEKLATTAKIWGFLKYYHPEVGKGKFNWDDQLIEILPKVKEAKDREELSDTFLEWINSLGEIQNCKKCSSKENEDFFGKNFDLDWISDSTLFSQQLISKLVFIEKNRFQGSHHYVSFKGAGNAQFKNEPEYPDFNWENKDLRLLTLFRYWNYIEYYFPYKYQIDKNWDRVLNESIPNFVNPISETDYHLAILELIVNIDDSHGSFYTDLTDNHFGRKGIPSKFKIIDEKAVITGFYNEELAREDDIKIGDVVYKVNGREIKNILTENDRYIYGSNASVKLRNAYEIIFYGSSDSVKIEFERNGNMEEKTIRRYRFKEFNYEKPLAGKWKLLDNNIGYVEMGELKARDVKAMMKTLFETKAIIFDIRNYPKGTVYAISKYLNKEPQEFVKFTVPDDSYPGKFNWEKPITCGKKNARPYAGKVILLVNENTQSHAEWTTMCLQTAENTVIIGSQTAGADGNVSRIKLVGGFETMFTGIGIFYPEGRETQRIGIVPDIEVKPTIEEIKNGRDEVFERAIQIALE